MEVSKSQIALFLAGTYLVSHLNGVERVLPEQIIEARAPVDVYISGILGFAIERLEGTNVVRSVNADTTSEQKPDQDGTQYDLTLSKDPAIPQNIALWLAKLNDSSVISVADYLAENGGKIDSHLTILPGDTFDFNALYGPFSGKKDSQGNNGQGYVDGPQVGGGTIIGAGVCQAATIVYVEMQKHGLEPDKPIFRHPAMSEVQSPNGIYVTIFDDGDKSTPDSKDLVWTNRTGKSFTITFSYDARTKILLVNSSFQ